MIDAPCLRWFLTTEITGRETGIVKMDEDEPDAVAAMLDFFTKNIMRSCTLQPWMKPVLRLPAIP